MVEETQPSPEKEVKVQPVPPKPKKGIPKWLIFFLVLMTFLIASIIIFFVIDASTFFIVGFYSLSLFLTLVTILIVFLYKHFVKGKKDLRVAKEKAIVVDEQLKAEAASYMFEMRSVEAGITKFFGIKPVMNELGAVLRVFGWMFKDQDREEWYAFGMQIDEARDKFFEVLEHEWNRKEYNEFLNEIGRGQREQKTTKQVITSPLGGQQEIITTEPAPAETSLPVPEQKPEVGFT